jgi:hypothetical protein
MRNPTDPLSNERRIQLRAEREAMKAKYSEFFSKVSALMFEHDPIGINFTDNADEYEAEAGTVIPRIESCQSAPDLTLVLHQEFCRWFGPEIAGPESHYEALAQAIWALAVVSQWRAQRSAA